MKKEHSECMKKVEKILNKSGYKVHGEMKKTEILKIFLCFIIGVFCGIVGYCLWTY